MRASGQTFMPRAHYEGSVALVFSIFVVFMAVGCRLGLFGSAFVDPTFALLVLSLYSDGVDWSSSHVYSSASRRLGTQKSSYERAIAEV